jgi:hypothetical protein
MSIIKALEKCANCENRKEMCKSCAPDIAELKAYRDSGLSPEEAQYLAELKKQGRLIELPCLSDNIIYILNDTASNYYCEYIDRLEIGIQEVNKISIITFSGDRYEEDDIGKTVFLTEIEVLKALK